MLVKSVFFIHVSYIEWFWRKAEVHLNKLGFELVKSSETLTASRQRRQHSSVDVLFYNTYYKHRSTTKHKNVQTIYTCTSHQNHRNYK